jgi:hypothetical protein
VIEGFIARARAIGYTVVCRAERYTRPDTGADVPAVYIVGAPGVTFRLRDDEEEAWARLTGAGRGEHRFEAYARATGNVRPPASPRVIGPIPVDGDVGDAERRYPQFASHRDLARSSYIEEELFFEGKAMRCAVPPRADGVVLSDGHPYRARMLVRRPTDAKRFNGSVIVEWLNVTAFANADLLWWEEAAPEALMRHGFAYVGLSVQRHGIHAPATGLRSWSPGRYGSLDVTGDGEIVDDTLCLDLFTQGGQAVRTSFETVLGGLRPQRLIAFGGSQSERHLRRYFNGIHPRAGLYDAFLLALGVGPEPLRRDVPGVVFQVNTETDVMRGTALNREPDSATRRTWEVPGSSHMSAQAAAVRAVLAERDGLPSLPLGLAERPPLATVPWGQALAAALVQTHTWLVDGEAPACAPAIALDLQGGNGVGLSRDSDGNAVGGVRLSQHEVATAMNSGLNSGRGLAALWGVHDPFDRASLKRRYPTRSAYVERVQQVNASNRLWGYVLEADAERNIEQAMEADLGIW